MCTDNFIADFSSLQLPKCGGDSSVFVDEELDTEIAKGRQWPQELETWKSCTGGYDDPNYLFLHLSQG